MTRELSYSDAASLDAELREAAGTLQMDGDAFRAFYDRTARSVWAYLSRTTGDARLADDLLQETYYRFLRASNGPGALTSTERFDDEVHRRNYLFRIATNLVHDARRRRAVSVLDREAPADATAVASGDDVAAQTARRIDVRRTMARLTPRERDLLWLAYANGSSHQEIAAALGLRLSSIKMLLFRARRRFAVLLGEGRGRA